VQRGIFCSRPHVLADQFHLAVGGLDVQHLAHLLENGIRSAHSAILQTLDGDGPAPHNATKSLGQKTTTKQAAKMEALSRIEMNAIVFNAMRSMLC